jgi:hypothetical protein
MKTIARVVALLAAGLFAYTTLAAQETAAVYQGENAEQFLAKAKMISIKPIGKGITRPFQVTLELNGVTHLAAFKTIDVSKPGYTPFPDGGGELNFQDSWQTEIAAYQVDRIIGLGLVPATIERSLHGEHGSVQWWLESMMPEADRVRQKINPPDEEAWNRQVLKMRLFDNLIDNVDRQADNILITKDFEIRLIDHSRSFRPVKTLRDPKQLTRFSRSLLEGIKKLELKDLNKRVGRYLSDSQIQTLLQRRDVILALANQLVAQKGEAAVIYP